MSDEKQFCTFSLDSLVFDVEVKDVQEVIRYQHITYVPRAEKSLIQGAYKLENKLLLNLDTEKSIKHYDQDLSSAWQ